MRCVATPFVVRQIQGKWKAVHYRSSPNVHPARHFFLPTPSPWGNPRFGEDSRGWNRLICESTSNSHFGIPSTVHRDAYMG